MVNFDIENPDKIQTRSVNCQHQLDLSDATEMPYEDGKFDQVICMLSLHEMSPEIRAAVLNEIGRVLKKDGRILLIDFHPGLFQPLQGWASKLIIFFSELAAGYEHLRNYRNFLAMGGLSSQFNQHSLKVEKQQILGGGTFAICLVRQDLVD